MTTSLVTDASAADRFRVGLVGAGGISRMHVEGWQALGATIFVFSTDGAEELAVEYEITAVETLDELLLRVDVIDIVTPSKTHREIALAAISAGKNIVCEKPLAPSTAEAIDMVQAAREAGVQMYPAHVVRYFPEYIAVKSSVDSGHIGDTAVLRFTRAGEAPCAGSWFFDETVGGGVILDQMIHDLDQARWLAGEITQVYAVQNPPSVGGEVAPTVTAHVILTHANGTISHVQGFWGPPGLTFRTSIDVAGSKGVLGYESPDDGAIRMDMPSTVSTVDFVPSSAQMESPYTRELREFAAAFASGTEPRVGLSDGVLAVALAEAAATSIKTGQAVAFDAKTVLAEMNEVAV